MPYFIITIDTEGDHFWAKPETVTTRNAGCLSRFQQLCESCGLRPVYLTSYEMARCGTFCAFARDVLKRQAAEIGMHLHAWNTPPLVALTDDDARRQPYLIEYPPELIDRKVACLTAVLEETFDVQMTSHRAGRWSFNGAYARVLAHYGYTVDCSVTPHVSWKMAIGDPAQAGGTDFRPFPCRAYFLDLEEISRPGSSPLLEVPMTVVPSRHPVSAALQARPEATSFPARVLRRLFPPVAWLRPNGRNLPQMLRIVRQAVREGWEYVEFMLHSSELMPGGSPTFPTERHIEQLYADLAVLFRYAQATCAGITLQDYYRHVRAAQQSRAAA